MIWVMASTPEAIWTVPVGGGVVVGGGGGIGGGGGGGGVCVSDVGCRG